MNTDGRGMTYRYFETIGRAIFENLVLDLQNNNVKNSNNFYILTRLEALLTSRSKGESNDNDIVFARGIGNKLTSSYPNYN